MGRDQMFLSLRIFSADRTRFLATRDFWIDALHLFALYSFSVAQPLYDLMGRYAEFLAVRESRPADLLLLVLTLSFIVPLPLVIVTAVAGLAGLTARKCTHAVIVAGFVFFLALIALKDAMEPHTYGMAALSGSIGLAGAWVYWRYKPAQRLLTVLSFSVIVFPLIFLLFTPVSKLLFPAGSRFVSSLSAKMYTPIFVVVFDEFPLSSLMNKAYQIDAVRYPHFAEFAAESYWFRNATSVAGGTTKAVPAILTGNLPKKGQLPIYSDHPKNLFTLFGDSDRMSIFEGATKLSPAYLCPNELINPWQHRHQKLLSDLYLVYLHILLPRDWSRLLPSVTQNWGGFNKKKRKKVLKKDWKEKGWHNQILQFIESIQPNNNTGLYYLHAHLPHAPWEYLPSGRRYSDRFINPGRVWPDVEIYVLREYQRHLLQVGYSDSLLGKMLKKIRDAGLFDKSLIIVTADHGISFRPGDTRRAPSDTNFQNIYWVPLFMKLPFQSKGYIIDKNIESVDIIPTIFEVIGADIPWAIDGHSVFDQSIDERAYKRVYSSKAEQNLSRIQKSVEPLFQSVDRKVAIFGSNNVDGLYRFGKNANLVGTPLSNYAIGKTNKIHTVIDQEKALGHIDHEGSFIPAHITGRMLGNIEEISSNLALAINSTVVATTETYNIDGEHTEFAFIVPESTFNDGDNHFEVFAINNNRDGSAALVQITRQRAEYYLVRRDDVHIDAIITANKERIYVVPRIFSGGIDKIQFLEGKMRIKGAAYNHTKKEPPSELLLFINGEYRKSVLPRKEGQRFRFNLLNEHVEHAGETDIKVFAISSDALATEMRMTKAAKKMYHEQRP
ncbi:MAG: sulfatase-like hydrolase/transferase [SAR324 cluster bacterium]|nr:sulfatase-like hydrolase/transferase [SAR324 cluster bacterium]